MTETYQNWLDRVKDCLDAINVSQDRCQNNYPFDFEAEYKRGAAPEQAAMNANRFWWNRERETADHDASNSG